MHHIDDILIQNGISPHWPDENSKAQFALWLNQARDNKLASFHEALQEIEQQKAKLFADLMQIQIDCRQIAVCAREPLEEMLSHFSDASLGFDLDAKKLTHLHIKYVDKAGALHEKISPLLMRTESLSSQNQATLLSPSKITECNLRKIALLAEQKNGQLLEAYLALTQSPLAGEKLAIAIGQLQERILAISSQISFAINQTSSTLTSINKNKTSATEYINVLHRLILGFHDIIKTIPITKEV